MELLNKPLKRKEIPFRIIEGEAVLVDTNKNRVLHLNKTATAIWEYLKTKRDLGEIESHLLGRFEIDKGKLKVDIKEFVTELLEKSAIDYA